MRRMLGVLVAAAVAVTGALLLVGAAPAAASVGEQRVALHVERRWAPLAASDAPPWTWPVDGATVDRAYVAPANRYGAGHRGVDLAAAVGATVVAPADGVVVFVGRVVDRGVLTLDVGGGVILTVEPIATDLRPGDAVARGDPLGTIDVGGHAVAGRLHLGVRVDGEYVDPMRFFGGVERAVLLPCC